MQKRAVAILAALALTGCGQATRTAPPPTPVPTVAPIATPVPPSPTASPDASGASATVAALAQQTAAACGESAGQIGQSVLVIRDQLATRGVVYADGAPFRGFAASTLAAVLRLHQSTGMSCNQAFVAVMDQTLQAAGQ